MIVTAAVFVENDDEHRLLPRFHIAAQRIVHGGDELVAKANDVRRMHIVGQIELRRKHAYVRIIRDLYTCLTQAVLFLPGAFSGPRTRRLTVTVRNGL